MADQKRQSSGATTATSETVMVSTGTGTIDSAEMICGCPEPGPETIQVEQVLGADMKQRVVEFDMEVPDPRPDIEQVIDVFVKDVCIRSVDVIPNKVIVRGELEAKVLYVAERPDQPVQAFEKDHVRWTRDIEIDGAMPDMKATADVVISCLQIIQNGEDRMKGLVWGQKMNNAPSELALRRGVLTMLHHRRHDLHDMLYKYYNIP